MTTAIRLAVVLLVLLPFLPADLFGYSIIWDGDPARFTAWIFAQATFSPLTGWRTDWVAWDELAEPNQFRVVSDYGNTGTIPLRITSEAQEADFCADLYGFNATGAVTGSLQVAWDVHRWGETQELNEIEIGTTYVAGSLDMYYRWDVGFNLQVLDPAKEAYLENYPGVSLRFNMLLPPEIPNHAVPEPSTLTLLGVGLVGLIGYRWMYGGR